MAIAIVAIEQYQGIENQTTETHHALTSDRQYLAKRMNWKSSQLSDSQKQLRVGRRSACRPVHSKSLSKCGGKSSLPWGQGKGPRMWTLGLLRLPCAADVARPLWEKACENMYPHFSNWYSEIQASIVSDKFIEEVTTYTVCSSQCNWFRCVRFSQNFCQCKM